VKAWSTDEQTYPQHAQVTAAGKGKNHAGRNAMRTTRRGLLVLVALLAAAALGVAPVAAQQPKPNIILILSDDFGYGDSGPYGGGPGRGMPTPSLDRLADEGMTFFSFYAQPSCTPAALRCRRGASRTAAA
jgi:hypothetical protein